MRCVSVLSFVAGVNTLLANSGGSSNESSSLAALIDPRQWLLHQDEPRMWMTQSSAPAIMVCSLSMKEFSDALNH